MRRNGRSTAAGFQRRWSAGAEVVLRGRKMDVLSGENPHTDVVVIRFPDNAAIAGWHGSAAYQALIPLREQAAEMVLISYES